MLSRLLRSRSTPVVARSRRRLELVFYRGEAKSAALRRVFGLESADAVWAGLYLTGSPRETIGMIRETLEALTPAYAGISFTLPTNDLGEHLHAKASLDAAGIRYDESVKTEPLETNGRGLSRKVHWLTGSTLNRDIYRLVFESMYDPPTLLSHRFVFTVSPPLINPDGDLQKLGESVTGQRGSFIVSTYYWRGLQLVSKELTEESIEQLAESIAARCSAAFEVRNR